MAGRIRLAFDGDRAGVNATERAINLAQEVGVELEVVSLPDGVKDPNELIKKDPALWQAAIDQSQPAVDWVIIARYAEMENLKSAEGKRRFSTIALRIVRGLKDPVEQEHYLSVISEKTGASITAPQRAKLSNEKVAEHQLKKTKIEKEKPTPVQDETEDILAGLAASEKSVRRWLAAVSGEMLDDDNARQAIGLFAKESRRGFRRSSAGLAKNRTVCENSTVEK
ncbi:toprim domain-containing protein [Candidatus Minimicrobia naudis]|uniref:Toprim domain-containing protein n=1 Tax=Candidatus Minimicrobia naudis TaxID=2841263 RepID=A0A8F1SB76_9BACT|nr:toprim domain-containing protein [Candidatus Minimicrobia naudis]